MPPASKSINGIVPFTDLSLRSLNLLATPRTPETVRNKVLSKAGNGTDERRCLNDPH